MISFFCPLFPKFWFAVTTTSKISGFFVGGRNVAAVTTLTGPSSKTSPGKNCGGVVLRVVGTFGCMLTTFGRVLATFGLVPTKFGLLVVKISSSGSRVGLGGLTGSMNTSGFVVVGVVAVVVVVDVVVVVVVAAVIGY